VSGIHLMLTTLAVSYQHGAWQGRGSMRRSKLPLRSCAIRGYNTSLKRDDYFLLFGLCPAGVLPDENGDGVAPPFLMFLSAFGFFFSLLLRI
jgi:hypothetical protein